MQRYLGVDVHSKSCTICVLDARGTQVRSEVLETHGQALVGFLKQMPGELHLCVEEGELAGWIYEILSPHVAELAVVHAERKQGPKSDAIDARGLAERIRTGSIDRPIFKAPRKFAKLRELSRVYGLLTRDVARTKNRLRSSYRRRGVTCEGTSLFRPKTRPEQEKLLPASSRLAVELLASSLDGLKEAKDRAQKAMVREARRHPVTRLLETVPGMGPVRVSQLLPIVVTPHRFRTKRQFWSYCGFGVVMRSSADWARIDGRWVKAQLMQTRGLNRNHNHVLKAIFKGAATTVITARSGPNRFRGAYDRLLEQGTKPNLAKLTVARKLAATVLAVWKTETRYCEEA
jgi:transposase